MSERTTRRDFLRGVMEKAVAGALLVPPVAFLAIGANEVLLVQPARREVRAELGLPGGPQDLRAGLEFREEKLLRERGQLGAYERSRTLLPVGATAGALTFLEGLAYMMALTES